MQHIIARTINDAEDLSFDDDQGVVVFAQVSPSEQVKPSNATLDAVLPLPAAVIQLRRQRDASETAQSLADLNSYITSQSYAHSVPYYAYRTPGLSSTPLGQSEDEIRREIRALKSLLLNRCVCHASLSTWPLWDLAHTPSQPFFHPTVRAREVRNKPLNIIGYACTLLFRHQSLGSVRINRIARMRLLFWLVNDRVVGRSSVPAPGTVWPCQIRTRLALPHSSSTPPFLARSHVPSLSAVSHYTASPWRVSRLCFLGPGSQTRHQRRTECADSERVRVQEVRADDTFHIPVVSFNKWREAKSASEKEATATEVVNAFKEVGCT